MLFDLTFSKTSKAVSLHPELFHLESVSTDPIGNDEPKCQYVVCQTKNIFLPLQIKICSSLRRKTSDTTEHSISFY